MSLVICHRTPLQYSVMCYSLLVGYLREREREREGGREGGERESNNSNYTAHTKIVYQKSTL